jgi:MFS family permease
MMPLHLFTSRTFSGANLLTFFLYAALGVTFYFLPFNLIRVQEYSPTAAGSALLPFTLLMFALSRFSGGLVTRYGARLPLVLGPSIVGVGYLLFALPGIGGSYWTTYFPAIVTVGLGMAVTVAPLTTAVMGAVSDQYAGTASGINNAVARVANLLAIAVLGLIVLGVFNLVLDQQLLTQHITPAVRSLMDAQRGRLADAQAPASVAIDTRVLLQHDIAVSFISGFRVVMLCAALLAFVSAICAGLTVPSRRMLVSVQKAEQQSGDNACTLTYARLLQDKLDSDNEHAKVAQDS